nr:MAG TPA: hypothetical protein [Caudoviricetes sp.]DAO92328.1 MAG TPA: hypothetical protein [Caudoviricetes sp.]
MKSGTATRQCGHTAAPAKQRLPALTSRPP